MKINLLFPVTALIALNSLSALAQTCQNCGIGTNNPTSKLHIRGCAADSTTSSFNVADSSNTSLFYVRDNKRIGINTTDPRTSLQVQTAGTGGINLNNTSGNPRIGLFLNSITTSTFALGVDASDGNKFKIGTSDLGTNTRFAIDGSGNVGIGTSSPATGYKLDVAGAIHVTGFKMPTGAANGYVLTSDASGVATWTAFSASGWSLTGNSGTSASTNFIGTTDAVDFITKTSNTERIRITSSGNIGIGNVASPTNILSIEGNSARTIWLERNTTSNTAGNSLTIQSGGATSGATNKGGGDLYLSSGIATGLGSSNLYLQTTTAGSFGTADQLPTTKMTVLGSGNVGIGTTGPDRKLDVLDASNPQLRLTYTDGTVYTDFQTNSAGSLNITPSSGTVGVGIATPNTNYKLHVNGRVSVFDHLTFNSTNGVINWGAGSGNLYFRRLSTQGDVTTFLTLMTIEYGGNVGIGTTSPSQKLQVDGGNSLVRGANNFAAAGNSAIYYMGDTYNYIKAVHSTGVQIGTYGAADAITLNGSGHVGIGNTSPASTLDLGGTSVAVTIDEATVTPSNPADGAECRIYMKNNKLIIQYNDAGTVRYKYLDLAGTGASWVHSTTAP